MNASILPLSLLAWCRCTSVGRCPTSPPHGDLHPGTLVARGGELVAVIDFGDVTAADPAYDLAVAGVAFDRIGRAAFRAELSDRYDDATWLRPKGWAASVALMLVSQSNDDLPYAALGAETVTELVAVED